LDTKEDSKNQPSPSPQDEKGGAEKNSSDNATEENTSASGPPDVQSESATALEQPESENSTSEENKDEQTEKDEPECEMDREGEEKSTRGDDESGEEKSPTIIAEDRPDSDHHEENEGDNGASDAAKGSVVEQGKEKERPAIVSYIHSSATIMNEYMCVRLCPIPIPESQPKLVVVGDQVGSGEQAGTKPAGSRQQ
jgi:hypothetical protein